MNNLTENNIGVIAQSLRTLAEVAAWYRQRVERQEAGGKSWLEEHFEKTLEQLRAEQQSRFCQENGDKNA